MVELWPLVFCQVILYCVLCFGSKFILKKLGIKVWETAVAQWLSCCATNRKVAGVIGIFYWHKILPIALWPCGRLSL